MSPEPIPGIVDALDRPWVLPTKEEKAAAYAALCDCDVANELLSEPTIAMHIRGERGPALQKVIAAVVKDPMELENAVYSGQPAGMQVFAILSRKLKERLKRRDEPPPPPPPPLTLEETKKKATSLFSKCKYAAAADAYEAALSLATPSTESDLVASLHANLAACRLKQQRWMDVVKACDAAVTLKAAYTKAIYRRAQAKRALGRLNEAFEDTSLAIESLSESSANATGMDATRREVEKLQAAVSAEIAAKRKEAEVAALEERGLKLLQGNLCGNLDTELRQEIEKHVVVPQILIDDLMVRNHTGMLKGLAIPPDSPRFDVTAKVVERQGGRFVYFSVDVAVPYRGVLTKLGAEKAYWYNYIHGTVRLHNINHYTASESWLSELGPELNADGTIKPEARRPGDTEIELRKIAPKLAELMKAAMQKAVEAFKERLGGAEVAGFLL
mmetsp:Transcript_22750/g.37662  ORF Transcript_22750/g.37662 Transcript_22750/m.37662 type:complete len:444 (-) Transcript_22750:257-1588(-)